MKIAWLGYDEDGGVTFHTTEPDEYQRWQYAKVVQIVYAEVIE